MPTPIEALKREVEIASANAKTARNKFVQAAHSLRREQMGPRILVVDDDVDYLSVIVRMLRSKLVAEVVPETEPRAAIERLRNEVFDLLIADHLYTQDGALFVHEARKIAPMIPIIVVSGFATKDEESVVRAFGIVAYILKPLGDEFVERVMGVIKRKRGFTPPPTA